ncbi:acyl carrier protein [Tropicibacter sp. S64]|uniref:acyl carrier protein n=1 Tax=Tropicibacter sp. S64 TaxID=3415122 RepID=UPI003C7B45EB
MTDSDPWSDVDGLVRETFAKAFPGEDITEDSDFFDLGGESIKAVEISAAMEQALGVPVHPSALILHPTVKDFVQALKTGRELRDTENS